MKAFLISVVLLLSITSPIFAQTATDAGKIQGIYDDYDDTDATISASPSATPYATPRTVITSTADTPVSGAIENTVALIIGGSTLLFIGIRFSKTS